MKTITIEAKDYLIFAHEPDWSSAVNVEFAYDTVIGSSPRYHEQRRSLIDKPSRTISASFLFSGVDSEKIRNEIFQCSQNRVLFPIYTEPIVTVASVTNAIYAIQVIDNYYNLRNFSTHIIGNDYRSGEYGSKEFASLSLDPINRINFASNWAETFAPATSVFYPAMKCRFDGNPTVSAVTAGVTKCTIKVKELHT